MPYTQHMRICKYYKLHPDENKRFFWAPKTLGSVTTNYPTVENKLTMKKTKCERFQYTAAGNKYIIGMQPKVSLHIGMNHNPVRFVVTSGK